MVFNERVKMLRKDSGMTQEKAAGALKMPMRTYQRLEMDGAKCYLDTAIKIADFYGVSLDYLMGRTDKKEINQ